MPLFYHMERFRAPHKLLMSHFSISKMHEKWQMATDFDEHFFGEWAQIQLTVVGGWGSVAFCVMLREIVSCAQSPGHGPKPDQPSEARSHLQGSAGVASLRTQHPNDCSLSGLEPKAVSAATCTSRACLKRRHAQAPRSRANWTRLCPMCSNVGTKGNSTALSCIENSATSATRDHVRWSASSSLICAERVLIV